MRGTAFLFSRGSLDRESDAVRGGRLAGYLDKRYTLADWRSWPDDERGELINGEACNISPMQQPTRISM